MELARSLPQGAARRTVALRMRLQGRAPGRRSREALETARLLAKHRAFSRRGRPEHRARAGDRPAERAHDAAQLQRAWGALEPAERLMPEVAIHAAQRLVALRGDARLARDWLLPVVGAQAEPSSRRACA